MTIILVILNILILISNIVIIRLHIKQNDNTSNNELHIEQFIDQFNERLSVKFNIISFDKKYKNIHRVRCDCTKDDVLFCLSFDVNDDSTYCIISDVRLSKFSSCGHSEHYLVELDERNLITKLEKKKN